MPLMGFGFFGLHLNLPCLCTSAVVKFALSKTILIGALCMLLSSASSPFVLSRLMRQILLPTAIFA